MTSAVVVGVTETDGGGAVVVTNPAIKGQRKSLLCSHTFDNMTTPLSFKKYLHDLHKLNLLQRIKSRTMYIVLIKTIYYSIDINERDRRLVTSPCI